MSLVLHFHPLSSFCQKVLIALYENGTPFERRIVDLGDAESGGAFRRLWPIGKMPVLRDEGRDRTTAESSIIIEYLDLHCPGPSPLIPADRALALRARLSDRLFDLHIQLPMQKIVGDRLRPSGKTDPQGVAEAKAALATAYGVLEADLEGRTWAAGDVFTMADCAAAPALFFADKVLPFCAGHRGLAAYFERLTRRPSVARTFAEAEPYLELFPG
jgi:glutathione S-transferase